MNIKLQDALIEISKEVETIKTTPTPNDIIDEQVKFNLAIEKGDMKGMRKHRRRLCALPEKLVSKMTIASLRGQTVWGHHGKKLQHIAGQLQVITNDILYNIGPRIYYIKK